MLLQETLWDNLFINKEQLDLLVQLDLPVGHHYAQPKEQVHHVEITLTQLTQLTQLTLLTLLTLLIQLILLVPEVNYILIMHVMLKINQLEVVDNVLIVHNVL